MHVSHKYSLSQELETLETFEKAALWFFKLKSLGAEWNQSLMWNEIIKTVDGVQNRYNLCWYVGTGDSLPFYPETSLTTLVKSFEFYALTSDITVFD